MKMKQYFIRFSNDFLSFRLPEFESLASLFGLRYRLLEEPSDKPFLFLETDDEAQLLKVFNRSLLTHSISEYWASNYSFDRFCEDLKSCGQLENPKYQTCSFKINVEGFGKKLKQSEKVEKIERLDFLPFAGPIKMKNPDETFLYFEYYGHERNNTRESPLEIIFGRWIADYDRKFLENFEITDRKFIANTTMDPFLSFLMSNIAKVDEHQFVFDPFVGSGGILLSAAYHRAYVWGVDIDFLLLHARAKPSRSGQKKRDADESVLANFKQKKLQSKFMDVIVGDSALPLFRENVKFDAIITDPPYGKRESRERVGAKREYNIPQEMLEGHIPAKLQYKIDDIYEDLMSLGNKHLRPGGRILFWVPYSKPHDKDPHNNFFRSNDKTITFQDVGERFHHPSMKLVSFSEQPLTDKYSRILVAMEKL